MLANAQQYDLIGMLGRQAVRICAISAVSGDPAHGSSEPARVLVDDAKQHGADMAIVFVSAESTWVTLEGFADRSAEPRAS